ncbi:MAG: hypothetical protein JXA30_22375 [Deltaproteobacteria bacterium]|nr:hypothetical protein [Deltaproteobacteria bacterium]
MPIRRFHSGAELISRMVRVSSCLLGLALVLFYFAQSFRLPPNTVDGALILGYLEEMCQGGLPYWNFIDLYGPLNWLFPYLFYRLADQQAWGVNLWMIVLKVITIGITLKLVAKLGNIFFALLSAMVSVLLLGQHWQLLNTPYASHTSYPLVLVVWYLLLYAPYARWRINLIVAGLLTAMILWTKINTGVFLLAAGLFYTFYWAPVPVERAGRKQEERNESRGRYRGFRAAQIAGLLAYGIVFLAYISKHFNAMYFLYLGLPLLICLAWTAREIARRHRAEETIAHHLELWLLYLASTLCAWSAFFLAYYGPKGGLDYLSEQYAILTSMHYEQPFLAPGAKSYYQAFSTYYWLQLPWLLTALFLAWLLLYNRLARDPSGQQASRRARIQLSGLWLFYTLHAFVIYPRSDEAHMFQAIIAAVPVLFLLLFHIEKLLVRRRLKLVRSLLAFTVLWACSTLAIAPNFEVFARDNGDWYGERLRYIKFRPKKLKGVGSTSNHITDHDWDIATNRTSICVDLLTRDGDEVLILTSNQLINYQSKTLPFAGGYRYLFYLLINDLLSRRKLEKLVPREIVYRLLHQPPRVIVSALGLPPMQRHFPEIITLMDEYYEVVQVYAHKLIYLPKLENAPREICGQTPELARSRLQVKIMEKIFKRSWFRD